MSQVLSLWNSFQASVFAQTALGVGFTNSPGKVRIGFALQQGFGSQLAWNIAFMQVFVNAALVYSYNSPTTEPGSTSSASVGLQADS